MNKLNPKLLNARLGLLATFLVPLLLLSCDRVSLKPLPQEASILAFGDSLTAGMGVEKSKSYPSVLSTLSGVQVINAGLSGEVTSKGLIRLSKILDESNPDLLILLEGGNDILRNLNPTETKNNLALMIELAQRKNIDVVLIGVPKKSLFSDVASFYVDLAEDYDLVFEDELIADLLRQPKYKSDSIHFNEDGYRIMAESIYELLVKHGAL